MENLFESFSHPDSIMFLISVFFCFLIGFLTGWALWGSRAKRYKKEAEKWKKSYDELTIEYKTLREQLDLKEADLVKAQREAEEAREQLTAFYQDKAKWQSDLDAAMNDTVKLQASISSYQATIDDLNNQILGLKARNTQLTKAAEKEGTALDQVSQMQSSFNATPLPHRVAGRKNQPTRQRKRSAPGRQYQRRPTTDRHTKFKRRSRQTHCCAGS